MSDSYVCSGAMMKCTMGTAPAKLTVLPNRTMDLCGQPQANISDHKTIVNLAPFGLCRSLAFPQTAAATAAALGTLTPTPCMHNTPMPWMGGKMDYLIKGQPALLKSCKCQCMWGGTISLITDGQVGEGTQWVRKKQEEDFEFQQEDNSGLNQDSVLDGIQLALDAAGFAPGVGAIPDLINASISALRGNWADAGMSLLAAVPLIGDAAAGVKIAKNGLKLVKSTKKVKAAKNTATTVVRIAKAGKGEKAIGKSSAKAVNQWWELNNNIRKIDYQHRPPYKKGTEVLDIELTEKKTFVRVYDKVNSGKQGGWLMEKESIEGLTPKQIQDKFALPKEPKYVVDVELQPGTQMRKGITAKVKEWGNGGGVQYDLKGQTIGDFKNERLLPKIY